MFISENITPIGDGNSYIKTSPVPNIVLTIRENITPIGDGNDSSSKFPSGTLTLLIRENITPIGDGNLVSISLLIFLIIIL